MVADYYTKPLQGALFRKFRDILMGLAPFPDEERVRYRKKVSKNINQENEQPGILVLRTDVSEYIFIRRVETDRIY